MTNVRSTWEDRSAVYGEQLTGVLFRGLSESANRAIDHWHAWLITELLAPQLAPGASVLDLGCGYGRNSRILLATRPDVQVVGADISTNYCRMYQSAIGPCACADMVQMPFATASFDGLMAVTSLMYAGERTAEVLAEIRRITRPGATVLFIDPGDEINQLIARLRRRAEQTPTGGKGFARRAYTSLFETAGYDVLTKGGNAFTSALLLVPGLAKAEGPRARSWLEATSRRDCHTGGYAAHALHRWVLARRR